MMNIKWMDRIINEGVLRRTGERKWGRLRLKYFDQIIGDMGCKTFREVKQQWDRAEWRLMVVSNRS